MLLVVANHPAIVDVEISCEIDESKASHDDEGDWHNRHASKPVEGGFETHIDQDNRQHDEDPYKNRGDKQVY